MKQRLAILVVMISTAAVFLPLLFCGWNFWDDNINLFNNPRFTPAGWGTVGYYWTNAEFGLWIPVTNTVWAAVASVSWLDVADPDNIRLNATNFRLVNLLVHMVSAGAVFAILRRLTAAVWPAAAGALLFALHPVQVEPVGWISGLKDLLSGMFCLLAMWQYVEWRRQGETGPAIAGALVPAKEKAVAKSAEPRGGFWARHGRYVLVLAMLALATMSKPNSVALPLMVVVLDVMVLRTGVRRAMLAAVPLVLVVVPVAVLTSIVQETVGIDRVSPALRPLVALDALGRYALLTVWPAGLTIDHGRIPSRVIADPTLWMTAGLAVAIGVAMVLLRRRWPVAVAGVLIGVVSLGPVLGLKPFAFQYISTVAEHYMYKSMFGLGLIGAWVLVTWPRAWVRVAVAAAIVAFGVRSMVQTQVWYDAQSLAANAMRHNPRGFTGKNNLASRYEAQAVRMIGEVQNMQNTADRLEAQGDVQTATGLRTRAQQVNQESIELYRQAAPLYYEAFKASPQFSMYYINVIRSLMLAQRREDAERAVEVARQFEISNQHMPLGARAAPSQPVIFLAGALVALGRFEEARAELARASAMLPNDELLRKSAQELDKRLAATRPATKPARDPAEIFPEFAPGRR